jgi:hypothetical protein
MRVKINRIKGLELLIKKEKDFFATMLNIEAKNTSKLVLKVSRCGDCLLNLCDYRKRLSEMKK